MMKEKNLSDWDSTAVLDAIGTAVLLVDCSRCVQGLNAAAQELLSISARSGFGRPLDSLVRMPESVNEHLQASFAGEGRRSLRAIQLQLRGGDVLNVDLSLIPFGESGVLMQLSGLDRPMRVVREDALIAQSESSRLLLRGLAHEVKNPLGGLRGAAQLLEGELPDKQLREYTQIIITEADRLHRLIDRMSGPKSAPVMQMINIHRVTEHVRQLLEADRPPDVRIQVSYDPSLPRVRGDFEWLVQALLNLGLNAVQAVGDSGVVELVTRAHSNFTIGHHRHRLVAEIQVRDNGAGIDEEMLERMFLPMVTGRSEGTGLGLPIAQNLIGHHGGLIECVSQPGETVFSVYLPLERDDE
ncbi:MAG: nitrogen regulation protein NR(II) [Granulosicoccaceae bacterium]